MHHYENITINLIVFSPASLKTQQEELAFTCTEKKKTHKNWSTTNNFTVRSLMTGKIAEGH